MTKVWCDLVYDTAIGKTKGTPDDINDNKATVKIQKRDTQSIVGLLLAYCATKLTDAELVPNAIFEITNAGLGITKEEVIVPNGGTDSDALQKHSPMKTVFAPLKLPPHADLDKLYDSEFEFRVSPSATNTEGLDPMAAVVYSDLPEESAELIGLRQLFGADYRIPSFMGGRHKADAAKAHGTGKSAVSLTAIATPSGTTKLKGLLGVIQPNAIVVDDPISGFFEFKEPGVNDFSPQKWPLPHFMNPCLGTVTIGTMFGGFHRYWPTLFDLPGGALSFEVESTLIIAAGTAPDTTQGVLYDR